MDGNDAEGALREVMNRLPTGVTVVAVCDAEGTPWGLTVNSFTSVSLDPPLVLVCIAHAAGSHDRMIETGGFGVNILSRGQAHVAARFASDPAEGRFESLPWCVGPLGHPVLHGAAAWLQCTLESVLPGGDHSILLGRVAVSGTGDEPALVFHRGTYSEVSR